MLGIQIDKTSCVSPLNKNDPPTRIFNSPFDETCVLYGLGKKDKLEHFKNTPITKLSGG